MSFLAFLKNGKFGYERRNLIRVVFALRVLIQGSHSLSQVVTSLKRPISFYANCAIPLNLSPQRYHRDTPGIIEEGVEGLSVFCE
jgi:hypothetical protein